MPEKFKKNAYDSDFYSPLSVQKPGPEPGPDVLNVPVLPAGDPLGFVPGGTSGGSIRSKKGKK